MINVYAKSYFVHFSSLLPGLVAGIEIKFFGKSFSSYVGIFIFI
tara:strand:+ start:58 stop:189 length:132 start_codon:yes stop_codon:yes gene_type:complete